MQLLFCKTVYILGVQRKLSGYQRKQAAGGKGQIIPYQPQYLINTGVLPGEMDPVGAVKAVTKNQKDIKKAVIPERLQQRGAKGRIVIGVQEHFDGRKQIRGKDIMGHLFFPVIRIVQKKILELHRGIFPGGFGEQDLREKIEVTYGEFPVGFQGMGLPYGYTIYTPLGERSAFLRCMMNDLAG